MTQQIKSIIERILRLKEEQDALASDIRDVYAEAKSNGHNKTALGQAVALSLAPRPDIPFGEDPHAPDAHTFGG